MIILERNGDEVFCEGVKLPIVAQAHKGPGKECVRIEGLDGSNGQKWVSLSKLNQGLNTVETKAREVSIGQRYQLTDEEQSRIDELQSEIDAIKAQAKARYVAKPNFKANIDALSKADKLAYIDQIKTYLAAVESKANL